MIDSNVHGMVRPNFASHDSIVLELHLRTSFEWMREALSWLGEIESKPKMRRHTGTKPCEQKAHGTCSRRTQPSALVDRATRRRIRVGTPDCPKCSHLDP